MSCVVPYQTMQCLRLPIVIAFTFLALGASLMLTDRASSGEKLPAKEPDVEPPAPSPDWQRLGPPQPGDWLYAFDEPGQTLAEYKELMQTRRPEEKRRVYVVPLGPIGEQRPELLKRVIQYFAIFFDTEVELLAAQALPGSCYNARRGQYDAGALLRSVLSPLVKERDHTLAMIGLTSVDLYHADLNFVFGIGAHSDRLGLCSICRFLPEGEDTRRLGLVRTLKTGAHEIGHILGVAHCTFYNCVMNGSNSLRESDRRSLFLCPVCLRKLEWYLGFNSRQRYEKLEAFFAGCDLKEEAAFCRRRIEELNEVEARSTSP